MNRIKIIVLKLMAILLKYLLQINIGLDLLSI